MRFARIIKSALVSVVIERTGNARDSEGKRYLPCGVAARASL